MNPNMPPPPSRQSLLRDFKKFSAMDDSNFQFERLVSRWARCGYELQELPLLVNATAEQFQSAIEKARAEV